jgi:hypothetical protein
MSRSSLLCRARRWRRSWMATWKECICWSPNWNEPQTDSGTPRCGILRNPYPNRFGESQNRFARTRSAFSHQTDNNTAKTSAIPIFDARDASGRTPLESARAYASSGRGAPRSSRRALTPRCPPTRRKRRGRGFGCGGGRGGGRLGNLPAPAGARCRRQRRRRSRRWRVDGGVVDACVGGGVSSFRAAN